MKIIVLSAKSSVGKDRLLKALVNLDIGFIPLISHTSRPKRSSEIEGKDYFFILKEEFLAKTDLIESREYNVANGDTWYYGLSANQIDINSNNTYITILDLQGLKSIQEYFGKDKIKSIYLKASPSERLARSLKRQKDQIDKEYLSGSTNTINEIFRRFQKDEQDFANAEKICDITLRNETEEDLENIIHYIVGLL